MGFYDAKGYWRNDGEGFYDAKGYFRSAGEGFYDTKGFFRSPGDGFYDARGNWVNPGGSFYDSKDYCRSYGAVNAATTTEAGQGIVAAIGFILFIQIALLWSMTIFLVEWITSHLYLFFCGYIIIDAILCLAMHQMKNHQLNQGYLLIKLIHPKRREANLQKISIVFAFVNSAKKVFFIIVYFKLII